MPFIPSKQTFNIVKGKLSDIMFYSVICYMKE